MKLIPLSTRSKTTINYGKYFAQVDDDDFDWINQWKWTAAKYRNTFYASRRGKAGALLMHRVILGLTDSKIVGEHKDHDGLNNRRNNIRAATHSENSKNKRTHGKSKYLGVNVDGKRGWRAAIYVNKKHIHLGYFQQEEDAAMAYDEAAKIHHKEFANLNFK